MWIQRFTSGKHARNTARTTAADTVGADVPQPPAGVPKTAPPAQDATDGNPSDRPSEQSGDEARLLNLYATTGRVEYLGQLYDQYIPLVYGVCMKYLGNREDSQDAVMQIFEKLVTRLPAARVAHFRGYLYAVAKNYCLMQLRQVRPATVELIQVVELPEDEIEDRWPLLERGLSTLPEEQQHCLRLFYLEQQSYQQVADHTGYSLKQVKSYLQNGKRNLKLFVTNHHE